jgi:hypothetical protein
MSKYEYEIKREIALPKGGKVTVIVSSPEPMDEKDYLILRPQAAIEMAACLADLADAMRPADAGKERK